MNKARFQIAVMAVFVFPFMLAGRSWSAPIVAKAIYVEGSVLAISIADAKMRSVTRGQTFAEGDRIKTSDSGVLEVELDTGDLIRLDKNSDLVIKALNRNPVGSTFSIFSLLIGRVKSAVTKLADSSSKFEYHTKAAVCGVSGTPPFIVESTDGQTNVDLLGEPGEKGSVYVKGFDPAETMVTVFSGARTVANFGSPPLAPFLISPERRQHLSKTIPFKTVPKTHAAPETRKDNDASKEESKEKRVENKGQQEGGGGASDTGFRNAIDTMTLNNLSGSVSVPKQSTPDEAAKDADPAQFGGQTQGVIGEQTTSSGAVAPPPASSSVQVHIKLK